MDHRNARRGRRSDRFQECATCDLGEADGTTIAGMARFLNAPAAAQWIAPRSEMDFVDLKARYRVAFEASRDIMKRNAEHALSGNMPSAADIEREEQAQRDLAVARRDLLAAIGSSVD
jgi:hypothetical protein